MFETHDDARLHFIGNHGDHFWGYVLLHLDVPCYFVEFETNQNGEGYFPQSILLMDVQQLQSLAMKDNVRLKHLSLLSPGNLNQSGRWLLEPLREICEVIGEGHQNAREYIYRLESGKQYVNNSSRIHENGVASSRTIFAMPSTK